MLEREEREERLPTHVRLSEKYTFAGIVCPMPLDAEFGQNVALHRVGTTRSVILSYAEVESLIQAYQERERERHAS